jgi:hypothetical protein
MILLSGWKKLPWHRTSSLLTRKPGKLPRIMPKHITRKAAAILLVFLSSGSGMVLYSEPEPSGAAQAPSSAGSPLAPSDVLPAEKNATTGSAMIIRLDPERGNGGVQSAAVPKDVELRTVGDREAQSVVDDVLAEVPSTAPGGGLMVNLKGRFMSQLTIHRLPDGKLAFQHRPVARSSASVAGGFVDPGSK